MKNKIVFYALACLSIPAHAAASFFSAGPEGWSAAGDVAAPVQWNSNGYISVTDAVTGGVTYFVAPSAFLGNQSSAFGRTLTFNLQQSYAGESNQFDAPDIILQGAGLSLTYNLIDNPINGGWSPYAVPLIASGWQLTGTGQAVSNTQLLSVLSNISSLQIRAEYQSGPDSGMLSNVVLGAQSAATKKISSTFAGNADGWSARGDLSGPVTWNPAGYISVTDAVTGGVTYFVAPSKYLGNQSSLYGGYLGFDLQQSYSGSAFQFDESDIILQGSGMTLVYDTNTNPSNGAWSSYQIPFSAGGWHFNTLTGAVATPEQLIEVLSNLQSLQIRAEYQAGEDTGMLKNVALVSVSSYQTPIPISGSLNLSIAGLGGLALYRRKKLKH